SISLCRCPAPGCVRARPAREAPHGWTSPFRLTGFRRSATTSDGFTTQYGVPDARRTRMVTSAGADAEPAADPLRRSAFVHDVADAGAFVRSNAALLRGADPVAPRQTAGVRAGSDGVRRGHDHGGGAFGVPRPVRGRGGDHRCRLAHRSVHPGLGVAGL